LQAWARDLRYSLAHDLAAREGCSAIAVAHTADDQAETILYRLFASPGRRALLGMPRRRGLIIRPLLSVRSRELRDWCTTHDLPWREDVSNADPKFARARVRRLLADAEAVHPAAVANVLRSADDLRAESAALDEIVSQLLAGAIDDAGALTVAALEPAPPALAALALRSYVEDAAGAVVPAAGSALADVLRLAAAGGSHALQLAGAELAIEYGKLTVSSGAARAVPAAAALPVPGTANFGHWTITAGEPAASDAVTATVRADAAAAGLLIRARDDGDRMRPAGLGGSKSLQDLFVDRKIPRTQRASHPVVCAGKEIIWIPGVAIAEGHSAADGQGTLLAATP
jgi:tRNA(Ile)-lysidine synthase